MWKLDAVKYITNGTGSFGFLILKCNTKSLSDCTMWIMHPFLLCFSWYCSKGRGKAVKTYTASGILEIKMELLLKKKISA